MESESGIMIGRQTRESHKLLLQHQGDSGSSSRHSATNDLTVGH
jgi:hypothetical protein